MPDWTPSLGALHAKGATTFRVWAPDHARVDLVVNGGPPRPLTRDGAGYWGGAFSDVRPGDLYAYHLDSTGAPMPDPASRFQPEGVHGPSQVIDPSAFEWSDGSWVAPALERLVFYELHVGTFTREGTFRAVIDKLPHLAALGVTAIELMPVGDFAGDRNWGYDGVAMFAPARCYGTPDDLRALADASHRHGLALFLDVVYNHFGPDGAYAIAFSEHYLTDAHQSPWGRSINADSAQSEHVRRFLIENALHWVHEYHVDGLRLDATHAIHDDSEPHFLAELTSTVRAKAPRPVVFVAEDHRNLASMLMPVDQGGYGVDAVWADDLHHELRVHAAGDCESYYADFTGTTDDIAATIRQGWFFTGQVSARSGKPRGSDPSGLSPRQFVVCIQNHDQIGNRADGARLNHEVDAATFRAMSVLLLLAPETPLLFMGQEWAATSPFLFFTDHHPELGRQVTKGRREEFSGFAAFSDPARRHRIPDPQALETFSASRLDWRELQQPAHARTLVLYRRTLALRHQSPALRIDSREGYDARAVDRDTVAVSLGRSLAAEPLLIVSRLSGSGSARLAVKGPCELVLTTEDPDVVEEPEPITLIHPGSQPELEASSRREAFGRWNLRIAFERPGAVVLRGPRLAP